MLRLLVFGFCVGVVLCKNVAPPTPAAATPAPAPAPAPGAAATPPAVQCGYFPSNVFKCLGSPHFIKQDVGKKCDRSTTEFTQFAREHPDWSEATTYVKEQCIGKELSPQGVFLDCPTYDFIHCAQSAFIRKAKPSQWLATPECDQSKLYGASCPVCPDSCFAPSIPIGSCKACLDWPKKS